MAKKRHTGLGNTAMPKSSDAGVNRGRAPTQPSGEVSSQRGGSGGSSPHHRTPYERGVNPRLRDHKLRRENLPAGGLAMNSRTSAMPKVGHQSATAPGSLAQPGSERGSATMDARSSVPASIQESCSAGDTRDRFGALGMYEKDAREDNAELDDGVGTGRRSRGTFRGNRRM